MFGLSDKILTMLQNYFTANPEVIQVLIYGSRAMGKERPGSDIDLAIITSSDRDISGAVQLDLEELSTPYMFDVIDYKRITHQPLREHIDRVGKPLFIRKQL